MKIFELETNKLKPYANNAKKHDQTQIDNVAESIKQYGFKQPIVVDKDNVIIIGHCRFEASKKLGLEKVPCVIADDLDEEQVKKLRLIDNKTNESEWDFDLLKLDIEGLEFEGFDIDWQLPETEEEVKEDNFDVEANKPEIPQSKLGDIYKLGENYLMCGDSTNKEYIQKLMEASGVEKVDLLFTDPPYNVNVSNSQGMTIKNDNMDTNVFRDFLDKAFQVANYALKSGGAFYVWHADSESINFREMCEKNDLMVKQCLIWVKNGFNFGRQDYKWQHEPCLYGWKEGAGHYFVQEYNHSTVIEDKIDVNKLTKDELKAMLSEFLNDKTPSTVIHENKPLKNDLHPTMKPLKMCGDLIKHSSRKGEVVCDLFGGSGSTLIICEQIQRKCIMIEYDPIYVDVIVTRWEQFTGKKAELVHTNE